MSINNLNPFYTINKFIKYNQFDDYSKTQWGKDTAHIDPFKEYESSNVEDIFAIHILGKDGRMIYQNQFSSENEMEKFCEHCICPESISFLKYNFFVADISSIKSCIQYLFCPNATAAYNSLTPFLIKAIYILLSSVLDILTLILRLSTFFYRYNALKKEKSHPLLNYFIKEKIFSEEQVKKLSHEEFFNINLFAKKTHHTEYTLGKNTCKLSYNCFLHDHLNDNDDCLLESERSTKQTKYPAFSAADHTLPSIEKNTHLPLTIEDIKNRIANSQDPSVNEARSFMEFENITATKQDLIKKFRQMTLLWHPDRNPETDTTNVFKWLQKCYALLLRNS